MKLIDAERLKDEIKHLKIDVYDEAHQFDLGARSSLTFLESFIDSLQQEQQKEPEKSLEEAAYKYSFDSRPSIYGQVDVIDAFIAGAEWQAKQELNSIRHSSASCDSVQHPDSNIIS